MRRRGLSEGSRCRRVRRRACRQRSPAGRPCESWCAWRGSLVFASPPRNYERGLRLMPNTVILSACPPPFEKRGGPLKSFDATELGGFAIANALERAEVKPEQV